LKRPIQSQSYNFLINRIFEDNLLDFSKKYLKGRLIDIGCGDKPYKELLGSQIQEYIGIDHHETSHDKTKIDLFGTAYEIPVEDNSFDSAICTSVLEHLEEPEKAIRECFRVLKPGAYVIYSVPFIWHLHEEPRDFYRYSKYGLKYLFEKSGFNIIEIKPLSGFLVTFTQLHLYVLNGKFNKGIIRFIGIFKVYAFVSQRIALFLNKYDNSKSWTWMYLLVAKK
jgi:SAM-dependent methyltransferase